MKSQEISTRQILIQIGCLILCTILVFCNQVKATSDDYDVPRDEPVKFTYRSARESRSGYRHPRDEAIKLVDYNMQPAASNKHHHKKGAKGWLDMGAWTKKKGAFGWYADYPVGKGKK